MGRVFLALLVVVAAPACSAAPELVPDLGAPPDDATVGTADTARDINPRLLRRFEGLGTRLGGPEPSAARVELGHQLFFDRRLSRDRSLACNSCHLLDRYGVDHQPTSTGFRGQRGTRNAPTVFHAAGHFAQFWDGRSPDVEKQALGPILNPIEMAMPSPARVVAVLKAVPGYGPAFAAAFPEQADPVTYENVGRALGAFERKLVTPSRWDRFLAGDRRALTPFEIDGFKLFADVGCVQCHTGPFIGGGMFQRVGLREAWPTQGDLGRFLVTARATDRMLFKVPSLRDVEMTGPYFHDGSVSDLSEAVRMMGRYQLAVTLTDVEVASITGWLKTLTGKLPEDLIREPALPPDGAALRAKR